MNPSYFRIRDNMENAIKRLEIWNRQPIKERIETGYDDAVDNALDKNGQWKGACLYVYENTGWTVFEDWTDVAAFIDDEVVYSDTGILIY